MNGRTCSKMKIAAEGVVVQHGLCLNSGETARKAEIGAVAPSVGSMGARSRKAPIPSAAAAVKETAMRATRRVFSPAPSAPIAGAIGRASNIGARIPSNT
jgi:hypothetical protein